MRPSPRALLCAATVTLLLGLSASAWASAQWQLAPAELPSAPAGIAPPEYDLPIGPVGDIEFWSPNRGLLITGGTEGEAEPIDPVVPAGVFAYDGVSWHQLSTVCGGASGKIIWAGPDEFWTIADQRSGQVTGGVGGGPTVDRSLCHFLDGAVVGSYAMPAGGAESYLGMDAGACRTPQDCWFGGEAGFHLHWDGQTVNIVNSPIGHPVSGMAADAGQLYESVQGTGGSPPFEEPNDPPLVHLIAASSGQTFRDLNQTRLAYPEGMAPLSPRNIQGPLLSTDGGPLGQSATQLWAVGSVQAPEPAEATSLLLLRFKNGAWTQVEPDPATGTLLPQVPLRTSVTGLAVEPGSSTAWVSISVEADSSTPASLLHLGADGTILETEELPHHVEALGEVGPLGGAGPIACPAPHDCWMATSQGWLFHLSTGAALPQDTDPDFHTVITYRPPDGGLPQVLPDAPPPDDSLANQAPPVLEALPASTQVTEPTRRVTHRGPLVRAARSRLLHGTTLEFSFTLTAKAHVRLTARRNGKVVARTPRTTLAAGHRHLRLRLNPRRWPTKLDLSATPLGDYKSPSGTTPSAGSNTEST